MKLSRALIDAVEAVLPGPGETGIPARTAHDRVARWGRTTVRHALAVLARSGRAEFQGADRHRLYRRRMTDDGSRTSETSICHPSSDVCHPSSDIRHPSWAEYGALPDGSVRRPD